MASVRTSLRYSFLNANAIAALQFLSTLLLARMLSPADFGVYSVAAVFIGIAQLLRDFGVTNFVVQTKEISSELLGTAFGLLLTLAWIVGLCLIAISPWVADFYRVPAVQGIMLILALNFFITPFGAVTLALAQRNMRFRELAAVGVTATVVGIATTLTLAYYGWGASSIAWGAVGNTLMTFLLSLRLRTNALPWLPQLRGARALVKFGGTITSANVLGYLNVTSTDLLLGRLLGMEAVGLFNRAASMNRYFATALGGVLGPVMLPWLSQLERGGAQLAVVYEKVTERISGISWPVYALIAIMAAPLVEVLFGSQWRASAALVPYICAAAMAAVPCQLNGALFVAKGKPGNTLTVEAVNLPIKVAAVLLAVPYGLEAVAATWPFLGTIGFVVQQTLLQRELSIHWRRVPHYLWKSFAVAVVAATLSWLTLRVFDAEHYNALFRLLAGGGSGCLGWFLMLRLVRHPLLDEVQHMASRLWPKGQNQRGGG